MPAPKPYKPLLTATERERLVNRNLDPTIRKRNEMIIRNKILSWLKNSAEVLLALEQLSTRKLKEEIDGNEIYTLLEIVRELLDLKDFGQLYDIGKDVIVVKPFTFHYNRHNYPSPKPHYATEADFCRTFFLESALEDITPLIPEPHASPAYEKFKSERWDELAEISAKGTINGKVPSDVEYWNRKGEFFLFGLSQTGNTGPDVEKSIKCFDKSLEINPNYIRALENKRNALDQLELHDEALKCSEKLLELGERATKINPSNAEAWFLRGQSLLHLGRHEEGAQNIDKAIEINPFYKNAYIKMPKYHNKKFKPKKISEKENQ